MPKFSVIIPVYNVERPYLEAALKSMLSQTFTDWECVCVDDGSTNDAGAVLDEFAAKDNRFKVYHTQNQGVGAARNLALDKANGEWITFLDADDLFHQSRLQYLLSVAKKYKTCRIIRNRVESFEEHSTFNSSAPLSATDVMYDLSQGIPFGVVASWEFTIHHSIIGPIRFRKFKNGEDGVFIFECIRNNPPYAFTSAKLYGYRQRQTSATHIKSGQIILDNFLSILFRLKMFKDDCRDIRMFTSSYVITEVTHNYVTRIVHSVPKCDCQPLWNAWFESLDFLASLKQFHFAYRMMFKICKLTHSKTISYLLSGVGLAIAWRLRLPFAFPLSPKAWEDETNSIIELCPTSTPA